MNPASCRLMADYNRWMNTRLYDAAARLSEAQLFEDRGAFFGSLFETLNHIATADTIWLHRFARHPELGGFGERMKQFPRPTALREHVAEDLIGLRAYRERADETIVELAGQLTDAQLGSTFRYSNTAGQPQARRLGAVMQHFFNHQTHHRGQATTLLFQARVDVGVTDLVAMLANEV